MYKIVVTPNSVLAQIAQPVEKFDQNLLTILKEMEVTLRATDDPKGVGLAAPQVGLSLRIFQMKPTDESPVTSYINPVIESIAGDKAVLKKENSKKVEAKKPKKSKGKLLEGCLSIPNIWGNVARPRQLTLSWYDMTGKPHKKLFKGFPAVIVQHEIDHLNGILFTKHVMEQGEKLYRSHKNEDGEDEFDEIKI